jgi:hypothetical protein
MLLVRTMTFTFPHCVFYDLTCLPFLFISSYFPTSSLPPTIPPHCTLKKPQGPCVSWLPLQPHSRAPLWLSRWRGEGSAVARWRLNNLHVRSEPISSTNWAQLEKYSCMCVCGTGEDITFYVFISSFVFNWWHAVT